jgi:hypothetical protein
MRFIWRGLLFWILLGVGAPLWGQDGTDQITPESIAQRIKQMKALAPRDWTKIPWTASLLDARRISRQEQRPMFLFTFEGNMSTGRC